MKKESNRKRILFANFPADGHFNPLTGLAVYLDGLGYDVRWYSSKSYSAKLQKLQIHHYPFKKALDVSDGNFDQLFPERTRFKSQIAKLRFDIINAFINRAPEYYADIVDIYREFPFDLMIADCAFTGVPFVKELMNIPVLAIGVLPLTETSRDLPPGGLGMEPSYTMVGKVKQAILRKLSDAIIFKKPNRVLHDTLDEYMVPHHRESVFDMLIRKCDYLLQIGTPGFEYYRSDLSDHIRYIGALLPYTSGRLQADWYDHRLSEYKKVILVTQGTVEKDVSKILVPTLEAFKDTDTLVICTTGGSQTQMLREKYPHHNMIIEDYIPFASAMKYADVYITNGGYGGVMLGIQHKLPLVVAGVHEGKNEINARVGYFKLGINLKTEKPTPEQVRVAAETVMADPGYRDRVRKLATEFSQYDPAEMVRTYVEELFQQRELSQVA